MTIFSKYPQLFYENYEAVSPPFEAPVVILESVHPLLPSDQALLSLSKLVCILLSWARTPFRHSPPRTFKFLYVSRIIHFLTDCGSQHADRVSFLPPSRPSFLVIMSKTPPFPCVNDLSGGQIRFREYLGEALVPTDNRNRTPSSLPGKSRRTPWGANLGSHGLSCSKFSS